MRESARGRTGRGRGGFDVGEIGEQVGRLANQSGGNTRGWGTAASGLAGAASGMAGGGLAQRFLGGGSEGSDEEFKTEVLQRLGAMEERLARLEDEVLGPVEEGTQGEGGTAEEAGGAQDAGDPQQP